MELTLHLFSTAVSIALTFWLAGVEIPEKIPCQEITEENLEVAVLNLVKNIREGNYSNSEYIWNKIECSVNISHHLKEESVGQIIKENYGAELSAFDMLSKLTHDAISQTKFKIRGYKELYSQLNISNQIYNTSQLFTLASLLKTETFFHELSSMFPKEVWLILLNKDIALRNLHSGGTLFVGGKGIFYKQENGERNVLVWQPGNLGPQGRWRFILNEDGRTFKILNTYWNLCLFEDDWQNRFDDQRGNVYASSCDGIEIHSESGTMKNGKWNIVLVPSKDGVSYIKINSAVRDVNNSLYSETKPELDMDFFRSRVFISYLLDSNSLTTDRKATWRVSMFR